METLRQVMFSPISANPLAADSKRAFMHRLEMRNLGGNPCPNLNSLAVG